jgi:hypothetical protein
MYLSAVIVLVLSLPFFLGYGVGYTLRDTSKWCINKLADNPISQFLIAKVEQNTPVPEEEIE